MKSALVLAPLMFVLMACAPAQTSARPSFVDTLLHAGQTWDMQGTLADGTPKAFSVTLGADVTRKPSGFVGYFDLPNTSGLAYGPADTEPEFLIATLLNLSDPNDAPICAVPEPSRSDSLTVFHGRLGRRTDAIKPFVTENNAEGLGTCTLSLRQGS
jgi:hypothetical protein